MSERPIVNFILVQVPQSPPSLTPPPTSPPATPPSRTSHGAAFIAALALIIATAMTVFGPRLLPPATPTPPAQTIPAGPARTAHDVSICNGLGGQ